MRTLISVLLVALTACQPNCRTPSPGTPGPSTLGVAATLAAADFEVSAPGGASSAVADDGSFVPPVATSAGLLVATPREGTAGAENAQAMYLAPTSGAALLVGPPWRVATDVAPTVNATTTVLSLLLLHPSVAHPSEEGTRQALQFMATRLEAGWSAVTDAARLWDETLAAGQSPFESTAFVALLAQALSELGGGLRIVVTPPESPQPLECSALLRSAGVVVSAVTPGSGGAGSQHVKPATRVGTALDYLYVVRRIPEDPAHPWVTNFHYALPALTETFDAAVQEKGVVPASSYASYLDVVGNTLRKVSSLLASPVAPSEGVTLAGEQTIYEIRFFSGGFGGVAQAEADAFQRANFKAEGEAALMQNLAVGVVEAIKLVPGAEAATESGGGEVLEEALLTLGQGVASLTATKDPSQVTADDLYALAYESAKAAVDKAIEQASEKTQEAAWKRFVQFIGRGGKIAVKTVIGLPGQLATGGALANRALRLVAPESLMEVWTVAVDTRETNSVEHELVQADAGNGFTFDLHCLARVDGRQVFSQVFPEQLQFVFSVAPDVTTALTLTCDLGDGAVTPRSHREEYEGGSVTNIIDRLELRFDDLSGGIAHCVPTVEELPDGRRMSFVVSDETGCNGFEIAPRVYAIGRTEYRNTANELTHTDSGNIVTPLMGIVSVWGH